MPPGADGPPAFSPYSSRRIASSSADPVGEDGEKSLRNQSEHLVPWLRVRGEKIFHRGGGRHGVGISVEAQLLLAGAVLGLVLARRR